MTLPPETIASLVRAALAEDIGAGDITTESTVPAELNARAIVIAKEPCIVAGMPLVEAVLARANAANPDKAGLRT